MATIDARAKAEILVDRIRSLVSEGKDWQQIVFDELIANTDSKAYWVEAVILAMESSSDKGE